MTKKLTTEMLQQYIGGEAELQNTIEGYLYRGQIKSIAVEDDSLIIAFFWVAKNVGGPPPATTREWNIETNLGYAGTLAFSSYSQDDIGRTTINLAILCELFVLFQPDGSALSPDQIINFPNQYREQQLARWQAWQDRR